MKNMKDMKNMKTMMSLLTVAAAFACGAAEVKVDFSSATGPVKPVNGVGQPPQLGWNYEMFHYLKDAGIPFSRLHDVGGHHGKNAYVDIPNLFRDFDADETKAENYDFRFTDCLLAALVKNGVEPFFRLGVTIENRADIRAYRIDPPKDFAKWARICERVIRHYNEGWANGFKWNIRYWEIWNEPENHSTVAEDSWWTGPGKPYREHNSMWSGNWKKYMELYEVTSKHLKGCFPGLKIGGYASCGFYAAVGAGQVKAANSSPRTEYFVECAKEFLQAARDGKWPLDFFSYHSYSAPDEAIRQVHYADQLLNEYGFTADRCERIYNEWLPYVRHENLGTALQAAGIASELIELQNGPCDVACIYDARCGIGNYSPLFNPMTYKPHKAYYAFVAFNELRKLGTAVKVATDGTKGLHATAAKGADGAAVLLANDTGKDIPLAVDFGGRAVVQAKLSDGTRTDETVPMPAALPPHSFLLVKLAK